MDEIGKWVERRLSWDIIWRIYIFVHEEALVSKSFSVLQQVHLSEEHDGWVLRHIREGNFRWLMAIISNFI